MAITVNDIKELIRGGGLYEWPEAIEGDDIFSWIDEAQMEIAKLHSKVKKEEVGEIEKWEPHELPSDFLRVSEVRDNYDKSRYVYHEIADVDPPEILFNQDGNYTVYYYKIPQKLDKGNNQAELDVHDVFRDAVTSYCLYKYWSRESEGTPNESQYANQYFQDFQNKIHSAMQILNMRYRKWPTDNQASRGNEHELANQYLQKFNNNLQFALMAIGSRYRKWPQVELEAEYRDKGYSKSVYGMPEEQIHRG